MPQTEIQTTESDPVLSSLTALLTEFKSHKERLSLRRNQLKQLLADGRLTEAELGKVAVEIYDELADTALSFQEDVTRIVYTAFADAELGDVEDDDEVDSQLLPGDAAILLGVVTDHLAMTTEILANWQGGSVHEAERARMETMKKQAEVARRLIDDITMPDEDDAPDDDGNEQEEDDDESDEADDAPPAN